MKCLKPAILAACLLVCSGCRCFGPGVTNCLAGAVDDIVDHSPKFDGLYCPALDLTRIGKPDWCRCPLNRAICCGACCDPPGDPRWEFYPNGH